MFLYTILPSHYRGFLSQGFKSGEVSLLITTPPFYEKLQQQQQHDFTTVYPT
jgi:hypothetical protein